METVTDKIKDTFNKLSLYHANVTLFRNKYINETTDDVCFLPKSKGSIAMVLDICFECVLSQRIWLVQYFYTNREINEKKINQKTTYF